MKNLITLLIVLTSLNGVSQIDSLTIINYYDTIVHYGEYSSSAKSHKKFKKDVKIFVKGEKIDYLIEELEKVVSELNDIISPINISITTNNDESNLLLFLGTRKEFSKINMEFDEHTKGNTQGFGVIYCGRHNNIYGGEAFVDIGRVKNPIRQKHILREEITQCLGLGNDTYQYDNSIFYQGYSTAVSYTHLTLPTIYSV
jgi:hypothetical protein